jgi:hypothetical protein
MVEVAILARSSRPFENEAGSIPLLVAKAAVERFYQGIVGWFSRTAEIERDLMQVGPLVESARNKFGTVVRQEAVMADD